jgi:beta-lactamase regulating signal transducer with metallopeptidase domain/protocatechuate 3,4-dioxygenase beta subunit/uncharacterized GH25 family protein
MKTIDVLGWTLVHSLWQIAAVAALLALALAALPRARSQSRYAAALIALVLATLCPLATVGYEVSILRTPTPVSASGIPVSSPPPIRARIARPFVGAVTSSFSALTHADEHISGWDRLRTKLEPALPALVWVWLFGIVLMSIRLAGGMLTLRSLRNVTVWNSEHELQLRANAMAQRLGIRRLVELRVSQVIESPLVTGLFKAAILFPASAITKLTPDQVDALLAHELAHIRRMDLLVNHLQSVVETVLFYHPAIWWISHMVRAEREHCCDDVAIRLTGDKGAYVSALISLEEIRIASPRLVVAARSGSLLERVQRMVGRPAKQKFGAGAWMGLAFAAIVILCLHQSVQAQTAKPDGPVRHIALPVLTIDGQPAVGAKVAVQYLDRRQVEPDVKVLVADDEGKVRFDLPFDRSYWAVGELPHRAIGIATGAYDSPVEPLKFSSAKTYRIKVMDKDHHPMAGVEIAPVLIVVDRRGTTFARELSEDFAVKTDSTGVAVAEGMPSKGGAQFGPVDVRWARSASQNYSVDSNSTLMLEPSREIDGVVTFEGKPVVGAPVSLVPSIRFDGPVRTDSEGHFKITQVPVGTFEIQALPDQTSNPMLVSVPQPIDTSGSMSKTVALELTIGGEITGQVVDERDQPVTKLRVAAQPKGMHILFDGPSARTDSQGQFKLAVQPGDIQIEASDRFMTGSQVVRVAPGSTQNIKIRIAARPEVYRVRCRLLDADGNPVKHQFVEYECNTAQYPHGEGSVEQTDDNGVAVMAIPASGRSTLVLRCHIGDQFSDYNFHPTSDNVTLKMRRVSLGSIHGRITDTNGQPLGGVSVNLGFSSGRGWVVGDAGRWDQKTDADGRYRWDNIYPGCGVIVMGIAPGHQDVQSPVALSVSGVSIAIPTMKMAPASSVSGVLVDLNGNPVANAQLYIESGNRVRDFFQKTDKQGRFLIDRVAVGTWKMHVNLGYKEYRIKVSTGQPRTYTIDLSHPLYH